MSCSSAYRRRARTALPRRSSCSQMIDAVDLRRSGHAGIVGLMAGVPASARSTGSRAAASLDSGLGFALGAVFRAYVKASGEAISDLPAGPRGYQVLAAAVHGEANTQSALAQRLGVDRTVMTYVIDDLEQADLV